MARIPVYPWQDTMMVRFEQALEENCWNPVIRENYCHKCRFLRCCKRKHNSAIFWSLKGQLDQARIDLIIESLSEERAKIRLKVTP